MTFNDSDDQLNNSESEKYTTTITHFLVIYP